MFMFKGGIYQVLGVSNPFDPAHTFVTSPVFTPLFLAILRLLFASYALIVTLFVLIWDAVRTHTAKSYFSFFTELSYIGLLAYFWAAGVQTLVFVARGQSGYPLQRWPRILQFLHMLLYSTITTFPIVVTIVFWSLLSSSSTFSTRFSAWSNLSQHALNTPFALFEILFTHAGPMPWIHIPFLIALLACYLGVAYITRATQGFYTYPFLNPHTQHGLLAAYIVGIGAGECVVFIIVRLVCVLRERLAARYGKNTINREPVASEAIDEWEEIDHPHVSGMV